MFKNTDIVHISKSNSDSLTLSHSLLYVQVLDVNFYLS